MPKFFHKILLLLWKNHLIQLTNRFELLWLLISPAIMCLVGVYLRLQNEEPTIVDRTYPNVNIEKNWLNLINALKERKNLAQAANSSFEHNVFVPQPIIAYAPLRYEKLNDLMQKSMTHLAPMSELGFENCTELRDEMIANHYFAGVCFDATDYIKIEQEQYEEFDSHYVTKNGLPIHFTYTLIFPSELRVYANAYIGANWMTNYIDDVRTMPGQRLNTTRADGHVSYVNEGFINLQLAISKTYLSMLPPPIDYDENDNPIVTDDVGNEDVDNTDILPVVSMRRFPVRNFVFDPLVGFMSRGLVILLIFGYLFAAQILVMQIVQEKGDLRNYLQNMNYGNVPHFVSWFLKGFIYNLLSSLFLLIILKINWKDDFGLYTNTPTMLLLMILLPYHMATITFCLMLTTFYKQTISIVRLLTLIWIFSYITFMIWLIDPEHNSMLLVLIHAFPNTLLAVAMKSLADQEQINYTGYDNMIYTLNNKLNCLTISECIWVFLAMTIIHSIVGLHRDILKVVDFNRAKGLLTDKGKTESDNSLHGLGSTHDKQTGSRILVERSDEQMGSRHTMTSQSARWVTSTMIFEVEPTYKQYKIKTRKLSKSYNGKTVLNGVTMNMYESEVTVLMGHNGAGKTTFMRILAGLTNPTHGTAIIEGHNIRFNRTHAAQLTGIAINENILFPRLSAYNQLRFTCIMKGQAREEAKLQANYYLHALNLKNKRNVLTQQLSSAERHLLLIASAFCGYSSVVLIDDLHADMDLPTQQLVWNLIEAEKEFRTVLIVTNSSELTEALSDRVAIIAHGELQCTGTKPFLRSMYGHGYRLICVMGSDCRPVELYAFLVTYMPKITVESEIGQCITFVLDTKFEEVFTQLLDNLEKRMHRLDVISCTLRETNINDIFMQMGANESDLLANEQYTHNGRGKSIQQYLDPMESSHKSRYVPKTLLLLHRMHTLLRKTWLFSEKLWRWLLFHCVMLAVATCLTYLTLYLNGLNDALKPVSFNLTQVSYQEAIIEFRGRDLASQRLYDEYTDILFWYDSSVREIYTKETDPYYLMQKSNITEAVHYKFSFGASFSMDEVIAWFNNIPLHAAPCSLNTIHNAMARMLFNDDATIDITMEPLPFEVAPILLPISPIDFGALLAIVLSLCFCLIWSGSAIFLIEERTTYFKKIQLISGANKTTFWFANLIADLCKVILLSIVVLIITIIFLRSLLDFYMLAWLFVALILSGANLLTIAYLFSLAFRNPTYGYIVIITVNMFGVVIFIAVLMLRQGNFANMPQSLNFLSQYTFCLTIFKLFYNYSQKLRCEDPQVKFVSLHIDQCKTLPNCCIAKVYWTSDAGIKLEIYSLLLTFLCCWCFLFLIEFLSNKIKILRIRRKPWKKRNSSAFIDHNLRHSQSIKCEIDLNVIREQLRVAKIRPVDRKEYKVICENISKSFKQKRVINRVDIALMPGESFGLLGLSGSGKTTLVRIMMGELLPSQGKIYIQEHNIGFCPQDFRLPQHFTPRQILETCARLRGLRPSKACSICENLAFMLGFYESYDNRVHTCSNGVVRRISVALAVLGEPGILYMDGAPCGIDAAGKVLIFNIISTIRQRGTTTVFSSLNASECEFMCCRTAILLNSQFWSLGEMNHLQQRHSDGYLVAVRMKRQVRTPIYGRTWPRAYSDQTHVLPSLKFIAFMETEFPESYLKEQRGDILIFCMPIKSTKLSQIFYQIRRNVFTLNVEDFYIKRNSLSSIYTDILAAELHT